MSRQGAWLAFVGAAMTLERLETWRTSPDFSVADQEDLKRVREQVTERGKTAVTAVLEEET